jgi:ribosomal protein S18 acetylase RimI-like enzyme
VYNDEVFECPVCHSAELTSKPYELWPPAPGAVLTPPYVDLLGRPSHEVCPRCGFEFGNDDDPGTADPVSFEEYRAEWQAEGRPRFDRRTRHPIDIQVLTPDDWPVWRELRLAALAESAAAFGSTLAEWTGPGDTEQRWRGRLSSVPYNIVLRSGGVPAGMVSAYVQADGTVELISMWVAPSARGRGVGDAAIRAVVAWAGSREVVLSVKTGNAPAIALYRRHGFVDAGRSPDDVSETLMRRPSP